MIKEIDIINFGSYKNFIWKDNVDKQFENRNIVYGRNYAGKTTLSRIFRSIEQQKVHEDFENGKFLLTLENGEQINEKQVLDSNLNIRVYNSDYKNDNLSVLNDKDGNITPFTILGEKNIKIEKNIKNAQEKKNKLLNELGSEKEKSGILWEVIHLNKKKERLTKGIQKKITKQASEINRDSQLFQYSDKKKQYNRTDFMNEIKHAKSLTIEEKEKCKNILKDEVKPLINMNNEISLAKQSFDELYKEIKNILSIEVKPSKTIEELLNNNTLQQWVKEGVHLHRDKRETCAFCQNELDSTLWDRIDAHFTKESEEYKNNITELIKKINEQLLHWDGHDLPNKTAFYSEFLEKYDLVYGKWSELKKQRNEELQYLLNILKTKASDIFSTLILGEVITADINKEIDNCLNEINLLLKKNNEYTDSLDVKQEKARTELRMDVIHKCLYDIDYVENQKEIKKTDVELDEAIEQCEKIKSQILNLDKNIRMWESEINDEEKAVQQINSYLTSFLGHPELSLEIDKKEQLKEKKTIFKIMRNNEEAYNLSEGEQSLIAFCYFLSSLKDITSPEEYIIFVDDPISSLDGNNLFYVFSLIDSEIARKHYNQLFVSTHNLDLLKYLQRIDGPTNNKKWKNKFFTIQKKHTMSGNSTSNILEMPNYLKKYATEFIYLFDQIYIVAKEQQDDSNNHSFYNFPNIARKFLESYLFFRYPNHKISNDKRLELFFGNSMKSVSFINRINNEFSHGENQFDRLKRPIDIPEFKSDAQLILTKIKEIDNEQYTSFCSSIGVEQVLD